MMAPNTPENAMVEPIDKSKSRDAKHTIIVQATMPICATDNISPMMLVDEKKFSTVNDSTANNTT